MTSSERSTPSAVRRGLDPVRCDECGHEHDRCLGHRKREQPTDLLEPCGGWPIAGSPKRKCRMHGGGKSSRHGRAAARNVIRRQAEGELGRLIEQLELDPSKVNYHEVLAEQVVIAHAVAAALKLEVGTLDTSDLYGPDHLGDARPHVLMSMLRDWTVDAARLSKMAIDVGVDERRVQLAEDRGAQIAQVLTVAAGLLFELLVSTGVDAGLLESVRTEQLPGVFRKAITTTLAGEVG